VGEPGTEISPEAVADSQREINECYDLFTSDVAVGRQMTPQQVVSLADGRVHIASQAMTLKLIDGIATLAETLVLIGGETGEQMATTTVTTDETAAAPAKDDSAPAPAADDVSTRLDKIEATLATLSTAIQALTSDENDEENDEPTPDDSSAKAATRLGEIMAAVGNRADFAVAQFLKGADAKTAKAELADVLVKENATLKAALPKADRDEQGPLALGVSAANDSSDPETMWASNIGGVRETYRNNKASFLAVKKYEASRKGK
jgi:hypothetical protein